MLDLSTAVLCDYAQVRDRLLFVCSGAVSRLYRQELPSPIGIMVGLVIEVPLEDSGIDHQLKAEVINRHGAVLATVQNTFRVGDDGLFPHEVQQVPLVVSITGVQARTWGTHQVRLYLDEELVRALTLYVVPAAGAAEARTPLAVASRPAAEAPAADAAGADVDSTVLANEDAGEAAAVTDAAPDTDAGSEVEAPGAADDAGSTDGDDAEAPALNLLSGLGDGEGTPAGDGAQDGDDSESDDDSDDDDSDSDDDDSDSGAADSVGSGEHVFGAPGPRGRGRGRRRRR